MDITHYYAEQGEGEPLVLLHGNGESHRYFDNQIAYFSASRRVIAMDTRGHGMSPRGTAPFTIRQFALDLGEFLDRLGLERVDLLGFSDGGNIALTFALDHPQRVGRLILNGANLDPGGVKASTQLPIELGYRMARYAARRDPRAVGHMEMLGLMVDQPRIDPEALRSLDIPTLVIVGTRDLIRAGHSRLIAANLPRGELVLIPGGHFIAARNPVPFNGAVDKFLRRKQMGLELEWKFAASEDTLRQLREDYGGADWRSINMESRYFDTPDRRLGQRRWTLRLRKENGQNVVCLKTPGKGRGRGEWEVQCEDVRTAIPLLTAKGAPEELAGLGEPLDVICGARFVRQAAILTLANGSSAELCLDKGELFGGVSTAPLCEIEVELKAGEPDDTERFAVELAARYGLHEETESKFQRARTLAEKNI